MSLILVTLGALLFFASAIVALFAKKAAGPIQIGGSVIGLTGCVAAFFSDSIAAFTLPWQIPGGAIALRLDPLSAFFAAPVFLVCGAGALYAERYWPVEKPRAGYVRAFYGILSGALALVMVASHTILFLALWEIVAISAFFLVGTDSDDESVRSSSWLFLAASHVATLALFGVITLLHEYTGSWSFTQLPAAIANGEAGRALFWLALIAFGIKAGMMPLHVWLPGAHAAGPSHVSAVMSGVVLKMGIYGLVRVLSLYPETPSWMGATILILGFVSAVLGVAFALAQHDLKRLLAYHSIENIGIILIGIGAALIARHHGAETIAFLALAGGLLHVWNHSLFKALLFFGAGAAIHGAKTREIDRMGGLARRMPMVAAAFLVGAVAISGLPPLNGFISEWLLYLASFNAIESVQASANWLLLIAIAPVLGLTGALALACFVKAFGAVFLGAARTADADEAPDAPAAMKYAMLPLAIACAAIGLFPVAIAPLLGRVVESTAGVRGSFTFAPLQNAAIAFAILLVIAVATLVRRVRNSPRQPTWDCGYAAPTARMQYTSSSLARGLVRFFSWVMVPEVHEPKSLKLFPATQHFESHVPDTVLDRLILPAARLTQRTFAFARYIQSGRVQLYLIYVFATLVALLLWSAR